MKDSVVVFFFTSSNHLSNVKTLQSIYKQDYRYIRLIVCNDCTYGFESERLLNNFEHHRPDNIEQIIFQENSTSIGEFRSLIRFWKQVSEGFVITLHSGEYFTNTSALSECVQKIKANSSVVALVCGCERRDNSFKKILNHYAATDVLTNIFDVASDGIAVQKTTRLRDCMVLYRASVLRKVVLQLDEKYTHICNEIVPWILNNGYRITTSEVFLCMYSEESINPMIQSIPDELGNISLEKIAALITNTEPNAQNSGAVLHQTPLAVPQKQKKRTFLLLLKKLSTVSRIMMYAFLTLLLFITSSLFLNLKTGMFVLMGTGFLILAFVCAIWTVGMLVCNLYLKRNPQRLVI